MVLGTSTCRGTDKGGELCLLACVSAYGVRVNPSVLVDTMLSGGGGAGM